MSSLDKVIYTISGDISNTFNVPEILNKYSQYSHLVQPTIVWQNNKKRAGTHSTLTKSSIKGGAKKPWKQKGTGRARAGDSNSPHWVGGAVAHGPHPRNYTTSINKSVRRNALLFSLNDKIESGLFILDDLTKLSGKTSEVCNFLKVKSLINEKNLFVYSKDEEKFALACRNINKSEILSLDGLNVYSLINNKNLIISRNSLNQIIEKFNIK